jgi:hypothetical protein
MSHTYYDACSGLMVTTMMGVECIPRSDPAPSPSMFSDNSFMPAVAPPVATLAGGWKKHKSGGATVRRSSKTQQFGHSCAVGSIDDRDRGVYCDLSEELRSSLTWVKYKKAKPQPLFEPGPDLQRPSFAIISAFIPNVSGAENKFRHISLMKELRSVSRMRVREVKGRWQGQDELSILVVNITKLDAIRMATKFAQDAYLYRAAGSPHAEIIDCRTGAKSNHGKWTEITREQAQHEHGFTFDPSTGRCYQIQPVNVTSRLSSKGWEGLSNARNVAFKERSTALLETPRSVVSSPRRVRAVNE